MINLKYLDCQDNMLTSLDVSNNALLEHLDISTGGDVYPLNNITEIDLSHNPNINELDASGWSTTYINLKNGNNNPDMYINIDGFYDDMGPEPNNHVCIEVDDATGAQNNSLPYSGWNIMHQYATYTFSANCSLSTQKFTAAVVSVYPNPTSDVLTFESTNDITINKVTIFDTTGRSIKEYNNIGSSISISDLQTGTYILKLISGKETFTQKIIKN